MINYTAIQEYITFQYTLDDKTFFSEDYYISKLRELLKVPVLDGRVGTFLSGGIDSSIVTILAAKKYTNLKTFTGAFDVLGFDETEHAYRVADFCGVKNYTVYPTYNDFVDIMPRLVRHLEEPCAGPGIIGQYMVARFASNEVDIMLSGQGADELFGGYTRYSVAKTDREYFNLIKRSDASTLSGDFQFDEEVMFERFQEIFNKPNTSFYNKMLYYDMAVSLPAILRVDDCVSSMVGIRFISPFLDNLVVKLATNLPIKLKQNKYILRETFKDILPTKIYERKDKMGFPVPIHSWSRDFFRDVLLSKTCRERGLFNMKRVEELIDTEHSFGRQLWGLLNIELWFRK